MAALFTKAELAALLQVDEATINTATFDLFSDLLTGLVEDATDIVVADETSLPFDVRMAALTAAARAYVNPQGFTSVTVDDFTYRRGGGAAAIGLYFTDDELASIVAAYATTGSTAVSSAFSISPVFDAGWTRTPTWPLP